MPLKHCTEVQQPPKVNQHMLSFYLTHHAAAAGGCSAVAWLLLLHTLQHPLQLSCHLSTVNNQQRLSLRQQQPLLELHMHKPIRLQPLQLHPHAIPYDSIACVKAAPAVGLRARLSRQEHALHAC
jgi:hypothetical protein